MKSRYTLLLVLSVVFLYLTPLAIGQDYGIRWGIQEGTQVSYRWEYEGDPFPTGHPWNNVTYSGTLTLTVLELDVLQTYEIDTSVSYSILRHSESVAAGRLIHYLHPLPIGNWSYLQSVFILNYPDATIVETETQLNVNYTVVYEDVTMFQEFVYSKADGVIDRASESWTNTTLDTLVFSSGLVRVYDVYPMLFIAFALSSIALLALVIYQRSRREPEMPEPDTSQS